MKNRSKIRSSIDTLASLKFPFHCHYYYPCILKLLHDSHSNDLSITRTHSLSRSIIRAKRDKNVTHLVAINWQVMLGEAQASGLHGAHSYSLSSLLETAPNTLRHPPVHPRPNPLPAPREVLALLPAPSSLLSLLARPFCGQIARPRKSSLFGGRCMHVHDRFDHGGNRDPARFVRPLLSAQICAAERNYARHLLGHDNNARHQFAIFSFTCVYPVHVCVCVTFMRGARVCM